MIFKPLLLMLLPSISICSFGQEAFEKKIQRFSDSMILITHSLVSSESSNFSKHFKREIDSASFVFVPYCALYWEDLLTTKNLSDLIYIPKDKNETEYSMSFCNDSIIVLPERAMGQYFVYPRLLVQENINKNGDLQMYLMQGKSQSARFC